MYVTAPLSCVKQRESPSTGQTTTIHSYPKRSKTRPSHSARLRTIPSNIRGPGLTSKAFHCLLARSARGDSVQNRRGRRRIQDGRASRGQPQRVGWHSSPSRSPRRLRPERESARPHGCWDRSDSAPSCHGNRHSGGRSHQFSTASDLLTSALPGQRPI